ncbi:hypothetical protein OHS18_29495 [Amycolatopsis sp. NBC_00355]|uniref:type II toxin-antitoxin system Phd/YefM family antitoxin n=1 Tax=Amycolatopsis sp. NBC_00355 TaxID=2975957 RepID=UPI002E27483D
MKITNQRELDEDFTAVVDAVEAGEIFHVTRNGVEIAELRPPLSQRHQLEVVEV